MPEEDTEIPVKMTFNYIATSGIAATLTMVPLAMILYIVLRNKSNAVLCMECQQCRAVCPVVGIEGGYIGPKDVMVAVKSGRYDDAIKGRIELCTGCAACVERCPRHLGVDELCTEIYNTELKRMLEDESIAYIPGIPNPQMKRTFEAVVRRIKGKDLSLPWNWITKAQRIRQYYNPFEDNAKRKELNEDSGDAINEIKELRKSLKFRRKKK
ncbi:MAG: (Fe-S)-binding protein [Candidatus Altiarchaeota archaeon]